MQRTAAAGMRLRRASRREGKLFHRRRLRRTAAISSTRPSTQRNALPFRALSLGTGGSAPYVGLPYQPQRPMTNHPDVISAIGNTPLIRLNRVSELTGCEIWGKAEFLNPGQSVKDRAALFIIRDAEREGPAAAGRHDRRGDGGQYRHRAGAGRQCAGLQDGDRHPRDAEPGEEGRAAALRRRADRGAGQALQEPQQLHQDFRPAGREARRRSCPSGAIWANQFDNVANRQAHVESTGPEIWEQTGGKIDGFICSVGSGGTLGGVAMALKERNPGRPDRPRRSRGRGALQLLHDTAS